MGSRDAADACFDDINANNPDGLVLTYEISVNGPVVFLDLELFKDDVRGVSSLTPPQIPPAA
eukprot:COSAG02_NODE_247_length_27137_cov_61.275057_6_plen_62_part_00